MFARSLIGSDTQLNQKSYYEASVQRPDALPPLDASLEADAVVVGAGFSGLSAALELAQRGLSVVVLAVRPSSVTPADKARSKSSSARPMRSAPGTCRSKRST
jgi:hypothetical protein